MMVVKRGSSGSIVLSIQEMLKKLGYRVRYKDNDGSLRFKPLEVDGKFGPDTEAVVLAFQGASGLLRDGIVGPVTMKALEEAYTHHILETHSPGVDAVSGMPDRFVFERVKADAYGEGYSQLSLRNDVASQYNEILEEVHSKGAILTSSGGIRNIHSKVTRSRSTTSFHYLGLALDLFIYSGMVDPEKDPYVVSREGERRYRVYARCTDKGGEVNRIEHAITYNDRIKGESVEGSFLDLTGLFAKKGFQSIRARPTFEAGDSMMGAEWWHFQYEKGLIPGVTTFGSELLKVYSKETLRGTPPWENGDRIFKINWF
ncbi:MAG: peptidoglycan-binding domain-containing protein [Thermodesulfobacteriota bacterium]|nr:peptidoglycan-binding domain-containing protein [Thermodesulfobacteriota bacterium]